MTVAVSIVVTARLARDGGGHIVIDELPPRLTVTEAEIEFVSLHLHAIVAALLDGIVEDCE